MRERWRGLLLLARTTWKTDPWRAMGLLLEPFAQLADALFAISLKLMIDGLVQHDTSLLVLGAAGIAAVPALWFGCMWTGSWIRTRIHEEVGFAYDREITTLTAALPGLDHHERADYQDRLELLRQSQGQLGDSLNSLINTANAVVGAISTIIILTFLSPWMLLLVLFTLPTIWTATLHQRWSKQAEERSAAPSRLARHLRGLAVNRDAGMELRVFGLQQEILTRFRTAWNDSKRPILTVERRAAILGAIRDLLFTIGFAGAVAFMLWRASRGLATVGDVVMAVYICQVVQQTVVGPIQSVARIGGILRAAGRLLWLRDYADTTAAQRPGDAQPPERLTDAIVFDNVSFCYPGTDQWVLRNVTLRIPAGSVVAIVGENGAGKTTLVKLLTRMYEPTEGRILVDNQDLAQFDVAAWRARLSAAFQDFARLELSAQHTIGIGDLPVLDDHAAVTAALARAGTGDVLPKLPHGAATQLGSSWDQGVDLSTGQWQKLALGRTMMRHDPLVTFFDEPTASLDAPTEADLFGRYADTARERTASGATTVLVSHRFSTVRMADLIVVIADGGAAEVGTHPELLDRGGLYAELYEIQATSYR